MKWEKNIRYVLFLFSKTLYFALPFLLKSSFTYSRFKVNVTYISMYTYYNTLIERGVLNFWVEIIIEKCLISLKKNLHIYKNTSEYKKKSNKGRTGADTGGFTERTATIPFSGF